MSGPFFDTVLVVDWSARSRPSPARPSRDAIWLGLARVDGDDARGEEPVYCRTRAEAFERIASLLAAEVAAGRRVLAGFDFPFGYPAGVAGRLTGQASALSLWRWLAERVEDDPDNASNRFAVASAINRRYEGTGPFWGRPEAWAFPDVPVRARSRHGVGHPAERRIADARAPGAKTVWQLAYAGAVGSQALLGLPVLERLRQDPRLRDAIAVWPLETDLDRPRPRRDGAPTRPPRSAPAGARPVWLAELYPSLIRGAVAAARGPGEIGDRAQVRVNALAFARLAADGRLAALFQGSPELTPAERRIVETEEAWILGLGHAETLASAARSSDERETGREMRAAPAPEPRRRADRRPRIKSGAADRPAESCSSTRSRTSLCANDRPAVSAPAPLRYERDPGAIYEQSFATVEAETRLDHLPIDLRAVAVRLVHACGMTDVPNRLAWSDDVARAARAALAAGGPVLCDCEMVASGIIRARLPAENPVLCTLNAAEVAARARAIGNTRSAAAVELWAEHLAGAVVAIGNAPTALFHLLELLDAGAPPPAAILGFPVGFVGAAESKAELARDPRGAAFLTLRGRRGGSAMAAAAVNALAAAET